MNGTTIEVSENGRYESIAIATMWITRNAPVSSPANRWTSCSAKRGQRSARALLDSPRPSSTTVVSRM